MQIVQSRYAALMTDPFNLYNLAYSTPNPSMPVRAPLRIPVHIFAILLRSQRAHASQLIHLFGVRPVLLL